MWPSGMQAVGVDLKGRIPEGQQATTGRALGRLSDIGWGNRLRPMLAAQAPDGPVPDDVLAAVVTVLADWARSPGGWAGGAAGAVARPVGVVAMPSRSHPHLVASLAQGVARIGRLPFLGSLAYTPQADELVAHRSNSAQRLRALASSFVLPDELTAALAANPGPVLLVDDSTESGWTLAVGARLLRQSGAGQVLPLVLAVAG
jgi:ATP-dependent DNA helicase RecQ